MNARVNRREVTRWMLSASIGSLAAVRLSASAGSFHGAGSNTDFGSVRNRIQQAIARGDATGVAVAVIEGGRIVWEEGFGWANREATLKATPHTPFSMASVTKPFTATTLMTLVAEGRLSLDAPANRSLVGSKILGKNGYANAATVRMLGAHVSGLPGMYESYDADEAKLVPSPNVLLEEYGRLAYPPATCYEYSNIGYAALDAIASGLTQTEFGALIHRMVLTPLGLNDSFFGSDIVRLRGSATRYDPLGHPIPHYTTSTPASGELYASAHDLARFILFNMGHRVQGEATILRQTDIDELHRPVFVGPSGVASTFGWFTSHTVSGVPYFFKSGGDPGVANRICFVPSRGLACVVVTNQSNAGDLAYGICDEVMTNHLSDWRRPEEYCGFPNIPFVASSSHRGRWEGALENGGANMPIVLNIGSGESATLAIGSNGAEEITEMRTEGEAFTGTCSGQINSSDAIRAGAKTLQIKLLPLGDRLVGRVFAIAGDPNFKNVRLPYVLTMSRNRAPFVRLSVLLSAAVVLGFCFWSHLSVAQSGGALHSPAQTAWGFDLTGMDRSVVPGDDFYSYANGAWNRRTEIPGDRAAVGSLADLRGYNANLRVRDLLEQEHAQATSSGTSTQKATSLYHAFMDAQTVEKLGDASLRAELQRLNQINSKDELAASMGRSFRGFGSSLFNLEISYDDKDPKHYAVHLGQGGLGLPSRDYYLEPQFAKAKQAYEAYVGELLRLAGLPNALGQAHEIVEFETRIAQASWTHAEERDPVKTYNPEELATLEKSDPDFPWRRFFAGAGLGDVARVVVTTKTSVPRLAEIFAATPLETLKAWQAFSTIDAAAPYLPDAYVQARFSFRLRTLGGQPTLAPRWMQAVAFVNEAMGSVVGELYVQKYFPQENQQQMAVLVANLRSALRDRLEHLPWMSVSTKAEALHKLANLEVQIGRPKVWIDYTKLAVSPDDLYGDAQREKAFDWQRRVTQIDGLWNKSDWRFWPQYATSYTENNQLIFTAAMLQAPFFNAKADPAINYGGIGSVIGHELTHSFDDQGRETDADNRLRNWWTTEDAAQFKERADLLSTQYSAMEPLPGLHLKGDVTLGENIADLGGVTIALEAYHESLHGKAAPVLDGFSGDQRFFLGWAQVWREKRRDDDLRQKVATDVHSPATARVNGVVRNMDSWYDSFTVQSVQKLFLEPEKRVRIW